MKSNELRTGGHDALFSPGLGLLCSGMLVGFSLSASNWNRQNDVRKSFFEFLLLGEKRSKLQVFLSLLNVREQMPRCPWFFQQSVTFL